MKFFLSIATSYGRIDRKTWCARFILLALLWTSIGLSLLSIAGNAGAALCAGLFVWCAISISAQRLHDTGRSAWLQLGILIPILGPLWILFLLLRRGVNDNNVYGDQPSIRLDYLKVDITQGAPQ